MECPHPHIQVPPLVAQPLEASTCIQRMAPPHVINIAIEPFEEVGDDKGLSRQSIEVNDENIANDRYTLLNDKLCNYLL